MIKMQMMKMGKIVKQRQTLNKIENIVTIVILKFFIQDESLTPKKNGRNGTSPAFMKLIVMKKASS